MASSNLTAAQSASLLEQIHKWRNALALETPVEQCFMGRPNAWYEDPHWFCPNGHVSGVFLKAEEGDRCLACGEPVLMGPAMTESQFGSLVLPLLRSMCDGLHD